MSPKQFFAGLAITGIFQLVIIILMLWCFRGLNMHSGFIGITIGAMILFCVLLFGAAKIYAKSSLVKLYIQLIMLAVFMKMILCVALIIGYQKIFIPADNLYIWPFLVIYLTTTIYEVIFLEKVGREKQSSAS